MSANGRPEPARQMSSGDPRARQLAAALVPYLIDGEVAAVVIVDVCDEHGPSCNGVAWRLGLAAPAVPAVDPFGVAEALEHSATEVRKQAIADVAQSN